MVMRPLGKVSIKWSPSFAYGIGLIATDGNLSCDGRHLNFTSKDFELAQTFQRCFGLNVKIGKKSRGSEDERRYFQVQFGDVLFYRWLLTIGLYPQKSKTIGRIDIPSLYYFDFLRGCFDGDGSIYSYWDPRWKSSFMFYLQFCSASFPFLLWLQSMNIELAAVKGKITKANRALQLRYAKKETLVLLQKMYYNKSIPCLLRKHQRVENIVTINTTHNAGQ